MFLVCMSKFRAIKYKRHIHVFFKIIRYYKTGVWLKTLQLFRLYFNEVWINFTAYLTI